MIGEEGGEIERSPEKASPEYGWKKTGFFLSVCYAGCNVARVLNVPLSLSVGNSRRAVSLFLGIELEASFVPTNGGRRPITGFVFIVRTKRERERESLPHQ